MSNVQDISRSTSGKGIRVISFFTGAGGLDLGFDLAGFDVVYATDIDERCCETLEKNLGGLLSKKTKVVQADIRKIDPETLPKRVDLVIGGPPCQSFSASGRRAGGAPGRLDDRGTLFEAYCGIIDAIQPKAFVFENVRGILGTNQGEDWRAIVQAFEKIGYRLSYRILDALDYGAPQQRERMVMVGHKLGQEFLFPEPLFGPDSNSQRPHITAGEALKGLIDEEDVEPLILRNGKYAHLLQEVPAGENYLHFTAKRGHPNPIFAYRSRFSDFLYKASPQKPIKTLIARPGKYTGPFHWDNRCFSVREYMRLQGFGDGYLFVGSRDEVIKQIGNSVSPKLAYQLALTIAKQIFGRDVDARLLPYDRVLTFDQRKGQKAQKTKAFHDDVKNRNCGIGAFHFENYESVTSPTDTPMGTLNTSVVVEKNVARITVRSDRSRRLFAKIRIEIQQSPPGLFPELNVPDAVVEVAAYGEAEHTIQTMWNAVDDWVIRSSNFHSLFELYGHFTEPHPIFRIAEFKSYSNSPIVEFAKHVASFPNCSTYFPREHLTRLFGVRFRASNFVDLVKTLRSYRFDIRCHETNITMPKDVYMVSYPFTLPFGKQMNFAVRPQRLNTRVQPVNSGQLVAA